MKYLIWSYEHDAWWRPFDSGYTDLTEKAGRYTANEAALIVFSSILLDEIAVEEHEAINKGRPEYHPYKGLSK